MAYAGARLALTFDDAPSMREPGFAEQFEPARMDRIREILQRSSVSHAVAFVISDWAQGSEEEMERWLGKSTAPQSGEAGAQQQQQAERTDDRRPGRHVEPLPAHRDQ